MKSAWMRAIPMSWLYRFVLFFSWSFLKVFYRHRVYGLEHYYSGAAIIASNHTSYLDPPILSTSWPDEVHFLARETLFKNPLFGGLITRLNSHPVSGDAGDIVVFKTIVKLLSEGKKVILFPEGMRSYDGELGEIKPGVAMLVSRTKSAVVPAYIHGAFNAWPRTQKLPKLWGKTACIFGSPILWAQFEHLDKREGQAALTEKLADAINSLRRWYESGAKGSPP